MSAQTITINGNRIVILSEAEYEELRTKAGAELPLPVSDPKGNYPAVETLNVIMARKIMRRRRAAGLTQVELAKRAGIRQETVNRIEKGKHAPSLATITRIDRVLAAAQRQDRARSRRQEI